MLGRGGEASPGPGGGEDGVAPRDRGDLRASLITFLVVAACTVFVFFQMQPSLMFSATTPAGGDMGAHVWMPAYLERVLFPRLQLNGWSMDWYAGFPVLTYFFPLPMWVIAVLGWVMPYGVAFKVVASLGILTLPAACWAMGRLAGMRFPGPACLGVAAVPFLFSRDFTIYGGNIASTMAGEFGFSISLSCAVLFIGLFARVLDTGRGKVWAVLALAACGLSHVLPLFFAVGGALVLLAMRPSPRRLRVGLAVLVVAGLVLAFWAIPFEYRLPYETNMGYGKLTTYLSSLFPKGDLWLFVLAAVGAVLAAVRRNRIGVLLLYLAVLSALTFRLMPASKLWNARALPFWFVCLYLLAGVAFSEAGSAAIEAWSERRSWVRHGLVAVPAVTVLVGLVWTAYPLRELPFGTTTASGSYNWLGITSTDNSYVPAWVKWNYSGYQSPDKSGRTAYFAIIREMRRIGATNGCGRAMYEYEPAINNMGTPDALMLLPYWTKGCIASMEGLYYESSATTPYHFLNASELSAQPSNPMRGLDYSTSPNVTLGVEHLQMLGVRYFMAVSPQVQAQAAADPSLELLASLGPFPTQVTNTTTNATTTQQQTWKIYRVLDSPLVQPLANQPVVLDNLHNTSTSWLNASEPWYLDPNRWTVYETAGGPRSWTRVTAADSAPPVSPEPATTVSNVRLAEQSVSFDVSRAGVPVLVKVSYFPNWHVTGARGVYRATPNLMVVVPTSRHVVLTYGSTWVDNLGTALSLLGLVALVGMAVPRRPQWVPAGWRTKAQGAGYRPAHSRAGGAPPSAAADAEPAPDPGPATL